MHPRAALYQLATGQTTHNNMAQKEALVVHGIFISYIVRRIWDSAFNPLDNITRQKLLGVSSLGHFCNKNAHHVQNFLSRATPRKLFVATPWPQISKDSGDHSDSSKKGISQRSNIFHTSCTIKKKVCAVVIYRGRFENFVTEALVRHLNLKTKKHPSPYYLSWLRLGIEVLVTETCLVPISLGKSYKSIKLRWPVMS